MTAKTVLLAARGLAVGRGEPLLTGVDLEVRVGECWFVLGRNGAGKSTLVQTLLGLLPPLHGTLTAAPGIVSRRDLGYVPQEQRFQPSLPLQVVEFAALGLADRRQPAAARRAAAHAALARMQVEALATRQVGALSLGQRRRVLVARALAREPRLLVLDEPTANLDAFTSAQLARDLERLRAESGLAMLHVAHDLVLAQAFATHVALVDGGRVAAGPAALLFTTPALQQALHPAVPMPTTGGAP